MFTVSAFSKKHTMLYRISKKENSQTKVRFPSLDMSTAVPSFFHAIAPKCSTHTPNCQLLNAETNLKPNGPKDFLRLSSPLTTQAEETEEW